MAGKKSKVKGNSFELKVSKILSEHLSPLKFIRVPGSGARVGGLNFDKFGGLYGADTLGLFVGDVVASNETEVGMKCKVSIECALKGFFIRCRIKLSMNKIDGLLVK
jgi:hypothetical protein